MSKLEKFQKAREDIQIRNWKNLSPYWKHICLMYFYRLKTSPDDMESYIETARFRSLEVSPDVLPDYIAGLNSSELLVEAYDVIGKVRGQV